MKRYRSIVADFIATARSIGAPFHKRDEPHEKRVKRHASLLKYSEILPLSLGAQGLHRIQRRRMSRRPQARQQRYNHQNKSDSQQH